MRRVATVTDSSLLFSLSFAYLPRVRVGARSVRCSRRPRRASRSCRCLSYLITPVRPCACKIRCFAATSSQTMSCWHELNHVVLLVHLTVSLRTQCSGAGRLSPYSTWPFSCCAVKLRLVLCGTPHRIRGAHPYPGDPARGVTWRCALREPESAFTDARTRPLEVSE